MSITLIIVLAITIYAFGKGIQKTTETTTSWEKSVFKWVAKKFGKAEDPKKSWFGPRSITSETPPLFDGKIGKIAQMLIGDIYSVGNLLMHIAFFGAAFMVLRMDYSIHVSLFLVPALYLIYRGFSLIISEFSLKTDKNVITRIGGTALVLAVIIFGSNLFDKKYEDPGGIEDIKEEAELEVAVLESDILMLNKQLEISELKVKAIDSVIDSLEREYANAASGQASKVVQYIEEVIANQQQVLDSLETVEEIK